MFVKLKNTSLKVPDPVRRDFIPFEGREVQSSPYWTRRIADGDVEVVVAEAVPEVVTIKASKTSSKGE